MGNQRNRRNLTPGELLRCIEALDRRKAEGQGGKREGAGRPPKDKINFGSKNDSEPSHKKTAETLADFQLIVGRIYNRTKKNVGAPEDNKNRQKQLDQNDLIKNQTPQSTAETLAEQHGIIVKRYGK